MLQLRIKEIAERQQLNRNQLQLRSGVTLPLLTRYWNNSSESVTLSALDKIARALGVSAIDLFVEVQDADQSDAVLR